MKRPLLLLLLTPLLLAGCKRTIPDRTGFLSGYQRLESQGSSVLEAPADDRLARYRSFIVDPVELRLDKKSNASSQKAAMLATELRHAVQSSIDAVPRPADANGSARVRMALTRIKRSAPLLNIHPGTKLTGAGLGEAGIEAEIVDAETGAQLWAMAAVRQGNRMELDAFNEYDDAEDAIAYWAQIFATLLTPKD